MVFKYKGTAQIKADPQTVGEVCQMLEQSGGLSAQRLVDASREETAPLHNEFEWNDAVAAEKHRETQAAYIIRNLVIEPTQEVSQPIRAFVNIERGTKQYTSIDVVMRTPPMKELLLEQAKKDLIAFKAKYDGLKELQNFLQSIDELIA